MITLIIIGAQFGFLGAAFWQFRKMMKLQHEVIDKAFQLEKDIYVIESRLKRDAIELEFRITNLIFNLNKEK